MKNTKYVIFDFNGTLTNDAEIGFKSCNHMLEFYGVPTISFKRFLDTFTIPWIDFYVANGVVREKINIERHQEEYQKYHKKLAEKELKLKSGVVDTLRFLKSRGIILGVLSARNQEFLTSELHKLGIAELFEAIIGEKDIYEDGTRTEKNTDRLILKMKIKDNSKVLYIGDMVIDVEIARSHGFVCGVMPSGWQSKEKLLDKKPDYVFEGFDDIKYLFSA
jgi:phosphoglycolate phosphatase-like HAD superfamily hydrolase